MKIKAEIFEDRSDPQNPGWAYRVHDTEGIGLEESGECNSVPHGIRIIKDILRSWGLSPREVNAIIEVLNV